MGKEIRHARGVAAGRRLVQVKITGSPADRTTEAMSCWVNDTKEERSKILYVALAVTLSIICP
ncbi:MAG TPA: hypothetical protein VMM82_15010 [Spirochaetia bacterium]|nr:hypothetical protein [Spirochaetia bacterium]